MIIIESRRDDGEDGEWINPAELASEVLDVVPEATVKLVKGSVQGVEVETAVGMKYLSTLYTAAGNRRPAKKDKGENDG